MIEELFNLKGKNVLITGSGRGIGYTLGEGLGKAGSTIILNDIDDIRLTKSVKALAEKKITVHGSVLMSQMKPVFIGRFRSSQRISARLIYWLIMPVFR